MRYSIPRCKYIYFFIKVIDVKKPLYRINVLLAIIYDGHIVKWQPYCKYLNILIVYEIKLAFLKFSTYNLSPKIHPNILIFYEIKFALLEYISFIPQIIFNSLLPLWGKEY